MKFGDKLKKQSEIVQTKEEAKDTLEKPGMLLNDDDLEKVSGGGGLKSQTASRCIYCHVPHLMTRYSPVSILYDGKIFRNCERYLCDVERNYFYIVTDYDGRRQFYLDQWMNEIMI